MQKLKYKKSEYLKLHEGHREGTKNTKRKFVLSSPEIASGEEPFRIIVIVLILEYSSVPNDAGGREVM